MNDYIGVMGGGDDAFAGAMGGTIIGVFLIVYFLAIFLAFALSFASYVLQSLGLYTIAGRRGLKNNWLAWVPIGNIWLLGSISDQYQYVTKGKVTNRRKIMLALSVAVAVVYVGWFVGMIGSVINGHVGGALLGMVLGWLLLMGVLIALCVFQYIACYDLFRSCHPGNAVMYLVLSIVFPVTLPFFVFACRKKDRGMPPRKQPPVQNPVAEEVLAEPIVDEPAEEPTAEEPVAQPEESEE